MPIASLPPYRVRKDLGIGMCESWNSLPCVWDHKLGECGLETYMITLSCLIIISVALIYLVSSRKQIIAPYTLQYESQT